MEQQTNRGYIQQMLAAGKSSQRQPSRKVWALDLEGVLLPFMVASNARHDSAIPSDALGAPLRLAVNQDGTAKFSKSGKPVIRIAKPISDHVKLMREGYVASLMQYTTDTQTEAADAVKAELEAANKAGAPILASDADKLRKAIEAQMEEAADTAEATHAENAATVHERELSTATA